MGDSSATFATLGWPENTVAFGGYLFTDFSYHVIVQFDNSGHTAGVEFPGPLHQFAASADKSQPIGEG